jgi:thioesterase domain-containing protein
VEAAPLPYLLALPAVPGTAEAGLPVLCFLHGYDEAAPLEIRRALARHGPLRRGSRAAAGHFLVVAPQLPMPGDLWHRYADAVRRIVEEVQRAHGGDPGRTYLTGFSFGGNGAFDLAGEQSGTWAAVWAVDPTRVPRRDPGCPAWLSFGEVARRGRDRFVAALGLRPADAGALGDRLYLDEGQDHVGSATLAYRDERVYDWLLTKRLPDR